jgi:chromosomal replication initiation ATPase DnaA
VSLHPSASHAQTKAGEIVGGRPKPASLRPLVLLSDELLEEVERLALADIAALPEDLRAAIAGLAERLGMRPAAPGSVSEARDLLYAIQDDLFDLIHSLPAIRAAAADGRMDDERLARALTAAGGLRYEPEVESIAAAAGVTVERLRGRCRRRELVELRRIVARYLRSRGCTLPEIGRAIGRDHTTVLALLRGRPRRPLGEAGALARTA